MLVAFQRGCRLMAAATRASYGRSAVDAFDGIHTRAGLTDRDGNELRCRLRTDDDAAETSMPLPASLDVQRQHSNESRHLVSGVACYCYSIFVVSRNPLVYCPGRSISWFTVTVQLYTHCIPETEKCRSFLHLFAIVNGVWRIRGQS